MTEREESLERLRTYNLIRAFAEDYKFTPAYYFPPDSPYKNIIAGKIYGTFDVSIIGSFFSYLKKDNPFFEEFKNITLLLFSDLAYRSLSENLVIGDLRRAFARERLEYYDRVGIKNVYDQVASSYYRRVLGKPIIENALIRDLYREIFAISSYDTADVIRTLDGIFKKYFKFERFEEYNDLFERMVEEKKPQDFGDKDDKTAEYSDKFIEEQFAIGDAEFSGNIYLEDIKEDRNKSYLFIEDGQRAYHSSDKFIEDFYGLSILDPKKNEAINKSLATGLHKGKKLYFTRGNPAASFNALFYKKAKDEQREKNRKFIEENLPINQRAINEIRDTILNSIKNKLEEDEVEKSYGLLDSTKVWRLPVLHDDKIFYKNEMDQKASFKVDLLLDSSASQNKRQALIANQAYIMAQAMDLAKIPVRVLSFSTLRDHTVFTLFRDYEEVGKNESIYSYYASGQNRDGLAYRAIHDLIKSDGDRDSKRILIILSDGRPYDEKMNINTIKIREDNQYKEDLAVRDTAGEIRKIREDGISILGVFTGEDSDLKNGKKIFGSSFVRIKSLENFSKIVSVYLKKEILL